MLPNVGWIAATDAGHVQDAAVRRLIRDYCFDYVTLPSSERPHRRCRRPCIRHGVAAERRAIDASRNKAARKGEMVGSCDAMLALFRSIRKVAMTDAPVFISGESGTGKELTAVAIHERSARRDQPFVAINCGAIPPHLLQSELFGYERGAFTGANQRKIGRVEAANGGTLFLDEIGDLPLESQASLLRFLQERKVERLGGHGSTPVDVRIISATHVDMQTAMIEGRFPRRPVSPAVRAADRRAAAQGARQGYRVARASTCSTASRRTRAGGCAASRRARSRRFTTTAGPATCAN